MGPNTRMPATPHWAILYPNSPDTVTLIRGYFLLSALAVVSIFAIAPLRSRFLVYGARAQRPATDKNKLHIPEASDTAITRLLDYLAACTVPHAWFWQFYALSVALSIYWLLAISQQTHVFQYIVRHTKIQPSTSMTTTQAICAWWLLALRGIRRYLESRGTPKSSSRMSVIHWVLGLVFYVFMSVAVWIEATPSLSLDRPKINKFILPFNPFELPGYRVIIGSVIFNLAGWVQSLVHKHLAELPRAPNYTMPTHPLFRLTLTPHYLAECIAYLTLSILTAPPGQLINKTVGSALVFVVVNLGITAHGTRHWYAQCFGEASVQGKARMIPFVW